MNFKEANFYIQSRGKSQHYDYTWKNLNNEYAEVAEKIYNNLLTYLVSSEIKSFLIAKYDDLFCLLITEINTDENERFANTPIRLNVLITSKEELDIREISLYYLEKRDSFKKRLLDLIEFKENFEVKRDFLEIFLVNFDVKFNIQNNNLEKKDYASTKISSINEIKKILEKSLLPEKIFTKLIDLNEAKSSPNPKRGLKEFKRIITNTPIFKSFVNKTEVFPIYFISEITDEKKHKDDGIWFFCEYKLN